jgi:hypothetical protein
MNRVKRFYPLVIATSVIFASISVPARAQKAISPENILDLQRVNDIQLSPDGKLAAMVLNLPGNGTSDEQAGAGMSDFFSMYGTPDGNRDELRSDFGASPYDARSAYDVHSPIAYVRACQTPTLLLHGQQSQRTCLAGIRVPHGAEGLWYRHKLSDLPERGSHNHGLKRPY